MLISFFHYSVLRDIIKLFWLLIYVCFFFIACFLYFGLSRVFLFLIFIILYYVYDFIINNNNTHLSFC